MVDLENILILNEINQAMLNQNQINGGLSQIIANQTSQNTQASKSKLTQNEMDEIFIIKLLKNFKDFPDCPCTSFFKSIRSQNPRLFNFIVHYFQNLLLKILKYNKSQTDTQ